MSDEQLSFFDRPARPADCLTVAAPASPAPAVPASRLRWYQQEAKAAIEAGFASHRSQLLVLATGLGKTEMFCSVAQDWPGNVLVLAHRDELVRQAAERLERMTGEVVQIEQGDNRASSRCRLVVGSIDTVKQKHRLERMGKDRFQLIISDECFPAGTMVDGLPIEQYRVGMSVSCVSHETGKAELSRVSRIFTKLAKELVTVHIGETAIRCTPNHPFFVEDHGYVEAKDLVSGDMCCVRRDVFSGHRTLRASPEELLQNLPIQKLRGSYGAHEPQARERAHAHQQPDAPRGQSGAHEDDAQGNGSPAEGARRKRARSDGGGESRRGSYRVADAGYCADENGEGFGIPVALQTGRCERDAKDRDRGGRPEPFAAGAQSPRPEERGLLAWARVDRIENHQPPGDDGCVVYNIEVEGAHTYFVEGVLVHNCHHFVGNTFVRPFEFFTDAKILGVTATPDRGDKKALGRVFERVAYMMDILEGIEQGYLVPIKAFQVELAEVNLENISKSAGDLAAGQLDEMMVSAMAGAVHETLRLEPDRQGILFAPGVKTAELAAELFNKERPNSARFVSGSTPSDERRQIVSDFRAGKFKYLCNCQVATEGFDAPGASLILQARPTLSRSLYAQMAGRGTRVLPGVTDAITGRERAEERRDAISASAKPDMVMLDFVGNSGKHVLCSPQDLLGGKYTDEEVSLAKKKAKLGGGDVREGLEAARRELVAVAAQLKVKVTAAVRSCDPFGILGADDEVEVRYAVKFGQKPPTLSQISALKLKGLDDAACAGLSKHAADSLLKELNERRSKGLASYKQLKQLQRFGMTDRTVTAARASEALSYIDSYHWAKNKIEPARLFEICHAVRQPGED